MMQRRPFRFCRFLHLFLIVVNVQHSVPFLLRCLILSPPWPLPIFTQEERFRCKMTQCPRSGYWCLGRHFWTNSFSVFPFPRVFGGGCCCCMYCICAFSYTGFSTVFNFFIRHDLTEGETMKHATTIYPVKRSAVYSSQGAALPVNNKALRRCSSVQFRSLYNYKYGSCHCYDYFKPSAVTRHCLLPESACTMDTQGLFFLCSSAIHQPLV